MGNWPREEECHGTFSGSHFKGKEEVRQFKAKAPEEVEGTISKPQLLSLAAVGYLL